MIIHPHALLAGGDAMKPRCRSIGSYKAKLFSDTAGQTVLQFGMTRDGHGSAGGGVVVEVMPPAMPFEVTTLINEFTNELPPFHNSTKTRCRCGGRSASLAASAETNS